MTGEWKPTKQRTEALDDLPAEVQKYVREARTWGEPGGMRWTGVTFVEFPNGRLFSVRRTEFEDEGVAEIEVAEIKYVERRMTG